MARKATAEVEGVGDGGEYKRIYIPARVSADSLFPFDAGERIRLQLVETTCERQVLVATSDLLEVDSDASEIEITRTDAEIQTSIEDVTHD